MITHPVTTRASKLILRTRPVADPTTDTGKRFLAGEIALSAGESFDKSWQFIIAPSGSGWAASEYLTAAIASAPLTATKRLYTLEGEDPELTAKIEKLQRWASTEGIEFTTADFGGVRTEADTTKILKYRDDDYAVYVRNLKAKKPDATPVPKETWRPINKFGTSMHNYGCARDLRIIKKPASFTSDQAMARLGTMAPSVGLRWGGTFKRFDGPHMELPITLAEARQRWEGRQGR